MASTINTLNNFVALLSQNCLNLTNMKNVFLFSMMCLMALTLNAQEFVDLGLPSGTLWKDKNESELFNNNAALVDFTNNLPSYANFEELKDNCKWEWTGNGYKVTGPNGNSIYLPTTNFRDCNGDIQESFLGGGFGGYWSSTSVGLERSWCLVFDLRSVNMGKVERCSWRAIRLVQKK